MINVLFMGRKPVAASTLKWLSMRDDVKVVAVVTDSHLDFSPTRDLAEMLLIPVLQRDELEKKVYAGELHCDLAVSVLYWQKIRQPVIKHCLRGVINFHPAPLPFYKGTAGYNLAILESLKHWAVSAHYVDEEIDTGPIIDVTYFDMDQNGETAKSLEEKTQPVLLEQIKRVLNQAIKSTDLLPAEKVAGGRYISRAEMEEMKKIVEGDDIDRKIRAFWFPPYDGAYIELDGVKYTLVNQQILQSLANPESSSLFTPKVLSNKQC